MHNIKTIIRITIRIKGIFISEYVTLISIHMQIVYNKVNVMKWCYFIFMKHCCFQLYMVDTLSIQHCFYGGCLEGSCFLSALWLQIPNNVCKLPIWLTLFKFNASLQHRIHSPMLLLVCPTIGELFEITNGKFNILVHSHPRHLIWFEGAVSEVFVKCDPEIQDPPMLFPNIRELWGKTE